MAAESQLSRVAVVIPALNEAESLRVLLPPLAGLQPGQIVVGDNGSTDATANVAREHGCDVALAPRRGYGAACAAALTLVRQECDVIVFLDADSSDDPLRLPELAAPVLDGSADLVIGCRDAALAQPGSMSVPQRFGNRLATTLIRWLWGFDFRDLGPFRAIRSSTLTAMQMQDRAFGWTVEMQVRAIQMKLRITQLAVPYRRRVGRSKISGTVLGVIRAGWCILTTIGRLYLFHPTDARPRVPPACD
jgi:hypothetical protein